MWIRVLVAVVVLGGCTKSAEPKQPGAGAGAGAGAASAPDGATATDNDSVLHAQCCNQCGSAAGRDPAGMDISTKDCRSYAGDFNGGPGVDDACVKHFEATRTSVGDCWKVDPNLK
jgi:hypothetical protein